MKMSGVLKLGGGLLFLKLLIKLMKLLLKLQKEGKLGAKAGKNEGEEGFDLEDLGIESSEDLSGLLEDLLDIKDFDFNKTLLTTDPKSLEPGTKLCSLNFGDKGKMEFTKGVGNEIKLNLENMDPDKAAQLVSRFSTTAVQCFGGQLKDFEIDIRDKEKPGSELETKTREAFEKAGFKTKKPIQTPKLKPTTPTGVV